MPTISGDAEIDSVRLSEQAGDPATPASGYWKLYAKSGGLYFIEDDGTVVGPLTASGAGIGDHGCKVYDSSGHTITTATATVLTWDSEEWDTDAYHDTVTNNSRITIPGGQGGKYLVVGSVQWAASTSVLSIEFLLNNTTPVALRRADGPASSAAAHGTYAIMNLSATDYVELRVTHTHGSDLATNSNQYKTFFEVQRLA